MNETHFADRLSDRCKEVGAAVCVGIDPVYERLPDEVRAGDRPDSAADRVASIQRYVRGVLNAVAPHAPCVKIQSACFERYLWLGVEAYFQTIREARDLGLIVIGDAKRGDIGVSASHYAAGCLGDSPFGDLNNAPGPDAITVNAYLGDDSLRPFLDHAAEMGKGVFALVRTSNPGGDAVQSLRLAEGRTVAESVAVMIDAMGAQPGYVGKCGLSLLGAVIGATKKDEAAQLRQLMPRTIFLVPGIGAQGAAVEDTRACFHPDGTGALLTASRSVLYAYEHATDMPWESAVRDAAIALKDQVSAMFR